MSSEEHPYSLVVERDGIVYVSGAASIDYATHQPVPGRREALDAALNAVEERLGTVGLDLSHVVKLSYFITDLSLRKEANDQIIERFSAPRPARTTVQVSGIPYGAVAAIEAIAHR
jgi:enamine deaminase RidA (YjgF/YER057c/UK114 family)